MSPILPYIVAFFAVSAYSLLGPMAKKVSVSLPPFTFIALSTFMLAVLAGLIGYFNERDAVIKAIPHTNWNWLILFTLVNLAGYAGYLWAITKIPVAQYEMFGVLMPIVGGLFAVYLLKEPFHTRYILSLLFIGVGIYIAIAPDLKVK